MRHHLFVGRPVDSERERRSHAAPRGHRHRRVAHVQQRRGGVCVVVGAVHFGERQAGEALEVGHGRCVQHDVALARVPTCKTKHV
jgi:IS5 family transposase